MLRHHSFAKSLVQEKERFKRGGTNGRLQLPHFAIRHTHMSYSKDVYVSKIATNRQLVAIFGGYFFQSSMMA